MKTELKPILEWSEYEIKPQNYGGIGSKFMYTVQVFLQFT
jgi:hypothetical protein